MNMLILTVVMLTAPKGNKRIEMRFLHKVSAEELTGGWSEGFENNTSNVSGTKDQIVEFNSSMLAIWLGPKPPNEPLKKGILGK